VEVATSVDSNLARTENLQTKRQVLERIEIIPDLTERERDKLRENVRRARGMGRIITIPFASGQTVVAPRDVEKLRTAVRAPQVEKLLADPTVVFVVLGYADKKGDPNANQRLSATRAESAVDALRKKCGLQNVMHAVGMGGSDLFDSGDQARNRVVEIWAVLP
jgi:outer membrane protein OmpA-like peptidoglycan-associated protein